jgi:glutathionyl-hydroquinone reductase
MGLSSLTTTFLFAVKNYDKYIDEMETALSQSSYLVGDECSLADRSYLVCESR